MVKWDAIFLKHPTIYNRYLQIQKMHEIAVSWHLINFPEIYKGAMYNPSPVAAKTSANKMPALEAAVLFDVAKGDLIAKAHVTSARQTSLGWLPGKARRAIRASLETGLWHRNHEAWSSKNATMNTCEHHLNISEQAKTRVCPQLLDLKRFLISLIYPLVNIQKTMERSTIVNGKTHYKWPCSIAILNYQRVVWWYCRCSTSPSRHWASCHQLAKLPIWVRAVAPRTWIDTGFHCKIAGTKVDVHPSKVWQFGLWIFLICFDSSPNQKTTKLF
jgi:hypothetical protein